MNKSINKLSIQDRINYLERFIIVHSIIYYHLNSNVISDSKYDEYAKYLEKLININNKEFKESQYYYVFIDYSSSTGFDLYYKLNNHDKEYLTTLANYILHNGTKIKEKGRKK